MKQVNSETRICEWPDDSELGQKPAQNTKIIKINDGPSFPKLYGWTVCLPCVGSEIQENRKFFLSNYQSLNSAMHWINPYPLDSSVVFDIPYPVDSDLSTQ